MAHLPEAPRDVLKVTAALTRLCDELLDSVVSPDCVEIPLVLLAAQYAEFANAMIPQDIPELAESIDEAIARIQHNIRAEMLRLRDHRLQEGQR